MDLRLIWLLVLATLAACGPVRVGGPAPTQR
jgi:hypothetical protein